MPDALDDVLQISFDALPLDDEAESEDEFSPDERFQVVDVEGEERISGLFEYSVVFEEPIAESEGEVRAAPALPIDELTGTDVTLSFHRDDSTVRYVNGVVARLVHDHTSSPGAAADRQRYRVEIRPELWLLTLTNDYRSFSGKTIPDIVATILDEYQIPYDEDSLDENLKDQYRTRKHVVQSGESTFEFIDGLLEDAGIFYFFRQQPGFHTLVFGDDNTAFPEAPVGGENGAVLRMGTTDQNDEETLWTGALEENVVPDGHEIRDTHFDGATTVRQHEKGDNAVDRKGRPLDVTEYPGGADRSTDDSPREHGPDILRRRLQQQQASKRLLRGTAPIRGLGTGQLFGLKEHDHTPLNGSVFVTRRLYVEASPEDGYRVEYEAFPSSTRFRGYRYVDLDSAPIDTAGFQGPSAFGTDVSGSGGAETSQLGNDPAFGAKRQALHFGTVAGLNDPNSTSANDQQKKGKVKVNFDSGGSVTDSKWARVLQPLASPDGEDWGTQFLPREGTKVLVAYDSTTDEIPVVIGSLYQGVDCVPYPEEGDGTKKHSVIRTRSERGENDSAVHNEIRFVDEKNQEELGSFAPHKRLEATGFEEDIEGIQEVITYELEGEHKPSDFHPEASPRISESSYYALPETVGDAPCRTKTSFLETTGISTKRISHEKYKDKRNATKFVPDEDYTERDIIKEKLKEEISGFENYLALKSGEPKCIVRNEVEINNLKASGEIPRGDVPSEQSIDSYNSLDDKTEASLLNDTLVINSFKQLLDAARKTNTTITQVEIGKDAYREPKHTKECYRVEKVGKDAFRSRSAAQSDYKHVEVSPHRAEEADASRMEYSRNGVLEACDGKYRIHTHGPCLEIYRANDTLDESSSADEFFNQEFSEDWDPGGPDKLSRFEEEERKPILVMNKGGSISIRAEKGINIESPEDINIQSSKSVNIGAKNININAEKDLVEKGSEIKIGTKKDTNKIEVESNLFIKDNESRTTEQKRSDNTMHWQSVQRGIWNDQVGLSNQQVGLTNSNALISLGSTLLSLSRPVIGISRSTVDVYGTTVSVGVKSIKAEQDIVDIEEEIMKKNGEIVNVDAEVVDNETGAVEMATFTMKKAK